MPCGASARAAAAYRYCFSSGVTISSASTTSTHSYSASWMANSRAGSTMLCPALGNVTTRQPYSLATATVASVLSMSHTSTSSKPFTALITSLRRSSALYVLITTEILISLFMLQR